MTTRSAPTPPPDATVEELEVWQREVWAPWAASSVQRRQGQRKHNGRGNTPADRRREERVTEFAEQAQAIDHATLIESLDEVVPND